MMDELLAQFLIEAREHIAVLGDDLAALARQTSDTVRIDSAFRAMHTLKGSVGIFDMAPAGAVLHAAEDVLGAARAGRRALEAGTIASLVAAVDQVDRWVDAMAQSGALPLGAAAGAERLVAALTGGDDDAAPRAAAADWAAEVVQRHREVIPADVGALVAFRYQPDPECFFRGDDPLAIIEAVPGLVALSASPRAPWPRATELQPFECNLAFEGVSTAPVGDVGAAFRFVADQVEIATFGALATGPADEPGPVTDAARSFRVDAAVLDALTDDVGELIVASNAFAHIADEAAGIDPELAARLAAARAALDGAIAGLRKTVTAARMAPIGQVLRRLPRLVREAASALGRDVDFAIDGDGTEIDKGIADALFEPLLHLLRNAIAHGIEPPGTRLALGKPARGSLRVQARRVADSVLVEVVDDGAGIDPARMRQAAVSRGWLDAVSAATLADQDAIELVFAPGFSTAAEVTSISGRGVGMDAVRTAIERLGGRIEIASAVDCGTQVRLRLPLTAVTTRVLTVRVGDERYAVPVERIVETASVASERILALGTGKAVVVRNHTLPFLSLAELLGKTGEAAAADVRLLVTRAGGEPVALGVDGFGAHLDVMLRPPAGLLADAPGLAGTTLMGDGSVLVALDLEELIG
jgi:two-component system chemotaxis sensor kinase CheA